MNVCIKQGSLTGIHQRNCLGKSMSSVSHWQLANNKHEQASVHMIRACDEVT